MKMNQNSFTLAGGILIFILAACVSDLNPTPSQVTANATSTALTKPSLTPLAPVSSPTFPPSATPTVTVTPSPQPTFTPTQTPTPDSYLEYTIDYLANRAYGGGRIEVVDTLAVNSLFTRFLVNYPSDDLSIYGFMNIPHGEGPFPVVVSIHGYIDPAIYDTIDYTTRYADAMARAGYLVLHPNLRNYPPSDNAPNRYRVGMSVDILNLIDIIQSQGGQPGTLILADPDHIGLWGHSMGGGVSIRVITVNPLAVSGEGSVVQAAVLYGAMSGDEQQNFEAILRWSDGQRGYEELNTPPEQLERISPIFHFDRIQAAVSIHHGRADGLVPLNWSIDTCDRLIALEKDVECFYYDGLPHTFYGNGDLLFIQRTINFFDRILKRP